MHLPNGWIFSTRFKRCINYFRIIRKYYAVEFFPFRKTTNHNMNFCQIREGRLFFVVQILNCFAMVDLSYLKVISKWWWSNVGSIAHNKLLWFVFELPEMKYLMFQWWKASCEILHVKYPTWHQQSWITKYRPVLEWLTHAPHSKHSRVTRAYCLNCCP